MSREDEAMDRAAVRWLDLHVRALDCTDANAEIELARRAWRRAERRNHKEA